MTIKTDVTELKRFIRLPGEVKSCAWQTGTFADNGDDWWLAAVLDVGTAGLAAFLPAPETTELFETPPGLKLESAFAALRTLPGAEITDSQRVRLITKTWSVEPYASSPLLNGAVIKISEGQVLVLLHTK